MDKNTVQALLELDVKEVDGTKMVLVPYESVLVGGISINTHPQDDILEPTIELPVGLANEEEETNGTELVIPMEIIALYPESLRNKMTEDVRDYLQEIARCWQYHNLAFTDAILKKAAKGKPNLNQLAYAKYGKNSDDCLRGLVNKNNAYIRECWTAQALEEATKQN